MSKVRESIVSNCEKSFLIKCLRDHTRYDCRTYDEFRNLQIKFGKDYGCVWVHLGETQVLAQVSCEIQVPKSSRPSEGILNINIELNPIAAPHFEAGRQSDLTVQLNRLLEKCIKDSKAVDLESLCIKMEEKVWALRVDINVLNHEGNILDCASIAALAALAHFRRPDITIDGDEFIIHDHKKRDPIPIVIYHYPICITYAIFNGGEFILADPNLLEENVAEAFITIGLNAYRELCGLHLGGKAELTPDLILQTTSKASKRAESVIQTIKEAVEKNNKLRDEKQSAGFYLSQTDKPIKDLEEVFNVWNESHAKKKNKAKKEKPAKIVPVDKGTSVLVPAELDIQKNKAWDDYESEEDEEVKIVEVPSKKVETITLDDSDSEEEAVVVLNKKSSSKKRKS